jgi:actin related protein 2/3 complex, subunit 3
VDEAIYYFRANVLFSSFELKGPADRVLVYLTLFIQQLLVRTVKENAKGKAAIMSAVHTLVKSSPEVPGEAGFPVGGGHFAAPASAADREDLRAYFGQLRQACADRLVPMILGEDGKVSKWWAMFAKRKFMNIAMH